jgi:hypothetical protein
MASRVLLALQGGKSQSDSPENDGFPRWAQPLHRAHCIDRQSIAENVHGVRQQGRVRPMMSIDPRLASLSGYAPALPTPFRDDGTIDGAAFERLCDLQIREGAAALVVCGTTGEAPTLRA